MRVKRHSREPILPATMIRAPVPRLQDQGGNRPDVDPALRRYYHLTTMAATSIKLPQELKKRVIAAAKAAGQSPHAFMLRAIEEQTRLAEARRAFVQQALDARESTDQSGIGYEATEVHSYLTRRAQGKRARRPKPKPWRG